MKYIRGFLFFMIMLWLLMGIVGFVEGLFGAHKPCKKTHVRHLTIAEETACQNSIHYRGWNSCGELVVVCDER